MCASFSPVFWSHSFFCCFSASSSSESSQAPREHKPKDHSHRSPHHDRGGRRGGPGGARGRFQPRGGGPGGSVWRPMAKSYGTAGTEEEGKGDAMQADARRPTRPNYAEEDIAPTAASMKVDPKNPTHPITLPFLNPHSFRKPVEPSSVVKPEPRDDDAMDIDLNAVPEVPSSAAVSAEGSAARDRPADMLFRADDGTYAGQDQIFFVQLPTQLPTKLLSQTEKQAMLPPPPRKPAAEPVKDEMEVDAEGDGAAKEDGTHVPVERQKRPGEVDEVLGFRSTLSGLPSGKIGKVRLYKSGKVRLVIGGIEYEVSTGMPCNFLQEAIAIDQTRLYQVGEIAKRMICYPIVEDLLATPEPVVIDD